MRRSRDRGVQRVIKTAFHLGQKLCRIKGQSQFGGSCRNEISATRGKPPSAHPSAAAARRCSDAAIPWVAQAKIALGAEFDSCYYRPRTVSDQWPS